MLNCLYQIPFCLLVKKKSLLRNRTIRNQITILEDGIQEDSDEKA